MYYNGDLKKYARKMRTKMTKEERKLWYEFLRNLPVRIYRQRIIGNYIADFYCPSAKTVIELDGSQHFEDSGLAYDKTRSEFFSSLGIKIIRYANNEVTENFEGVCSDILDKLNIIL